MASASQSAPLASKRKREGEDIGNAGVRVEEGAMEVETPQGEFIDLCCRMSPTIDISSLPSGIALLNPY